MSLLGLFWRKDKFRSEEIRGGAFSNRLKKSFTNEVIGLFDPPPPLQAPMIPSLDDVNLEGAPNFGPPFPSVKLCSCFTKD